MFVVLSNCKKEITFCRNMLANVIFWSTFMYDQNNRYLEQFGPSH